MDANTERQTDVARLVEHLAEVLRATGLAVAAGGASLIAKNTREVEGATAAGRALNPGLRQEVVCNPDADGMLWWFWAWSGPTRDSPAELEPLCPAANLEWAAERIAHVLAIPSGASSCEVPHGA